MPKTNATTLYKSRQAWVNIDQETIKNLVHSMENRIFQVINRNRSATDYYFTCGVNVSVIEVF
jgi:hypothetical protein